MKFINFPQLPCALLVLLYPGPQPAVIHGHLLHDLTSKILPHSVGLYHALSRILPVIFFLKLIESKRQKIIIAKYFYKII